MVPVLLVTDTHRQHHCNFAGPVEPHFWTKQLDSGLLPGLTVELAGLVRLQGELEMMCLICRHYVCKVFFLQVVCNVTWSYSWSAELLPCESMCST